MVLSIRMSFRRAGALLAALLPVVVTAGPAAAYSGPPPDTTAQVLPAAGEGGRIGTYFTAYGWSATGTTVTCSLDGGTPVDCDGSHGGHAYGPVAAGPHTLTATAVDGVLR